MLGMSLEQQAYPDTELTTKAICMFASEADTTFLQQFTAAAIPCCEKACLQETVFQKAPEERITNQ
jgi:hypothetical protein